MSDVEDMQAKPSEFITKVSVQARQIQADDLDDVTLEMKMLRHSFVDS